METNRQRETVRDLLNKNRLTQVWLIDRLNGKGIVTCNVILSEALQGHRKGPKVEQIIRTSYEILTDYETKMNA